jgi:D-alanine-D-alanine ligase-like ATP-grasp enzyme
MPSHQLRNSNGTFRRIIYPKMKELAIKVFRIGSTVMDNKKHSFEIFGLDYLIDQSNKVWLIEVNNNPSLEICSSLLARLVPNMI